MQFKSETCVTAIPLEVGKAAEIGQERPSLRLEAVAEGDGFKFHADGVHDGDDGARLEYEGGQHRAELMDGQGIVAVQHHIATPVADADDE